ncbi:MAG: DUF3526 domain-containing protein, partial [Rhodobacteraceae bacterium]|nr:DUF3526 domain-containing protein [Paracoccaceae bacterium]
LFVGPIIVLGLIALALAPGGAAFLPNGIAIAVVYILYGFVFLFLTLAVSAVSDSARTTLVVMVAFWAVSSVALPKAASDIARLTTQTPPATEFQKAIASDMENGIGEKPVSQLIDERRQATLRLYKVDAVEKLPINFQGIVLNLQEQMGNLVFDKHFGKLFEAMAKQLGTIQGFSTVSPRLAVQMASMELAGTSLAQHEQFVEQAEAFRRGMIDTMNQSMTVNSTGANPEYRAGPELWTKVGTFRFQNEAFASTLARLGPSFVVMLLWLAGSVVAAVLAVRRLKVMVS